MNRRPIVTVLIPTWDAPTSLGPAIDSARAQTLHEIEILVVCDGAKASTLTVARERAAIDRRVRVAERPKAPSRGEVNRHWGVLAARAPLIAYLADDDLLLPHHLENLVPLLDEHDLVQSANGYIDATGHLRLLAADLADPRWHAFHLLDPPLNRISITGTAHTAEAYRRLERGWVVPEPSMPADLTLWRQFFRLESLRAATHPEMTTIRFPAPERRHLDSHAVQAQREHWDSFIRQPDVRSALRAMVDAATERELRETSLDLRAVIHARSQDAADALARETELRSELATVRGTLSWRLSHTMRRLRSSQSTGSSSR